jgi:nucleotide-binding universal stress UspA family protein
MEGAVAKERKILLCIDEFPNSHRAVEYVGRLLGNIPGFEITVVSIVEEPGSDHFQTQEAAEQYLEEKRVTIKKILSEARDTLIRMGVPEKAITVKLDQRRCESLAQCIIEEQQAEDFGTVVVGRRGISKDEEFLFGSVSNKIIRYARGCTIWVVE